MGLGDLNDNEFPSESDDRCKEYLKTDDASWREGITVEKTYKYLALDCEMVNLSSSLINEMEEGKKRRRRRKRRRKISHAYI